jgi:uncharacterized protein
MLSMLRTVSLLAILAIAVGASPQHPRPPQRAQASAAPAARTVRNRAPLQPGAYTLLPLGSITPQGWLRRQLEIQARGLTGHLDEIWPDVGSNSGWLGGTGESWERGPYYLDGLLPLAYLLQDQALIAKANRYVEWTLTHQASSGALGPPSNTDWWPTMVMLKVLTQYADATGDPRVVPALTRYFTYHLDQAGQRPLYQWAAYRWADELLSVVWLYNRTGDPRLLTLARTLHNQGADWRRHFAHFEFESKTSTADLALMPGEKEFSDRAMRAHGVNTSMGLKTSAVWSLLSGDASDRDAITQALSVLDKFHGQPNGMFTADEHYAGRDPSEGTELCAVVEAMFSLEQVIAVRGGVEVADRLERISYNALPATISPDMWAHQYDQQANQILCSLRNRRWVSNGPESNLFGLEPNFGCCTANMHQGWPKLVASLWMGTPDLGLAAIAYGPSQVRARVGRGIGVTIDEHTDYPFHEDIELAIEPDVPYAFPLELRIPSWATNATVRVNGIPVADVTPGAFLKLQRTWHQGDEVTLHFPMSPAVTTWYRDGIAIERGPLVFSLPVGEDWRKVTDGMKHPASSPAADWEIFPTTPWNYGLVAEPGKTSGVKVDEHPVGETPFSPTSAAVSVHVTGRKVPEWRMEEGSAGTLPQSPVISAEPDEALTLVPYGSARLRVTVFPSISANPK